MKYKKNPKNKTLNRLWRLQAQMADALAYANKHWPDDPVEKVEMTDGRWSILSRSGNFASYQLGRMLEAKHDAVKWAN
jgi:hypothetical protein